MKPHRENPDQPQPRQVEAKENSDGIVQNWISRIRSRTSKVLDWLTVDWTFDSWEKDKSWKWKESKPWRKWKSESWKWNDRDDDKRKAA